MRFRVIGDLLTTKDGATTTPAAKRPWRYDCQSCGACCCNTTRNRLLKTTEYVEITRKDRLFKEDRATLKRVATENAEGAFHMRLVGDEQRCVALEGILGDTVRCSIYTLRPEGCRLVESGDEACRAARRQFGFSLRGDDDDDDGDDDDDDNDDNNDES